MSSGALSTAPCRGSSGPLGQVLACRSCTSKAASCPGSLAQCQLVAGASSALPLAPSPQGFLLVQNSLAWAGLQLCYSSGAATLQLSLPAVRAQGRHQSAFPASLAKKHRGGASLGRQTVCLSSLRVTIWKIPLGTTHHFFFWVWSVPMLLLQVVPPEGTGLACPVFLLLLPVALWLSFARLQGMVFQAELKNASACSWLHMHTLFMLQSTGSENPVSTCNLCDLCP